MAPWQPFFTLSFWGHPISTFKTRSMMGVSLQMFIETTKIHMEVLLAEYLWKHVGKVCSVLCLWSKKNKSNNWFQSGSSPMFFSQLGMMALFEGHVNFGEVLNLLIFFRCKLADLLFLGGKMWERSKLHIHVDHVKSPWNWRVESAMSRVESTDPFSWNSSFWLHTLGSLQSRIPTCAFYELVFWTGVFHISPGPKVLKSWRFCLS